MPAEPRAEAGRETTVRCTPLWRCSAWWDGGHQDECRGDWLRERVNVQRRYCVVFGWRLW